MNQTDSREEKSYFRRSLDQRKLWQKISIAVFSAVFAFFLIVGLMYWKRPEISETEKRTLASKPTLTVTGLMDGTWFTDFSTWYTDTYPLREPMIHAYQWIQNLSGIHVGGTLYGGSQTTGESVPVASSSETAPLITPAPTMTVAPTPEIEETETVSSSSGTGEPTEPTEEAAPSEEAPAENSDQAADGTVHVAPEVAGTVYVNGNQGFDLYYFSVDNATTYASMVNTVSAWTGDNINVYSIIPSNAFGIYLDAEIQQGMTGSYVGDAMNYIYSLMNDSVKKVNSYDTLVSHNSEYLYFRTDHHWTSLGAYYTYVDFCRVKGVEPHSLDQFQKMDFPGFLGTFYAYSNQNPALGNEPDTVTAYIPMGTNDMVYTTADGDSFAGSVIADATEYSSENKYLTFIAGDQAFEVINNPEIESEDSCVLIKDSYGNAFAPYLVDHYKNVYVVDYRYYKGDLTQFCIDNHVSDVILMSNIEAVTADRANMILSLFSDHSSES